MAKWILLTAAMLLAGCDQRGRYIVTPSNPPIMTDTTNGETWRLDQADPTKPVWRPIDHELKPPR